MSDTAKFSYRTDIRVRNFEVDWQGIVHNAVYLQYFETGRIEYLKHVGLRVDMEAIRNDSYVVVVRNEINYRSPAVFDEVLHVYTRMARIGRTSFVFEGYIVEAKSGRLIADNLAFHVWLDPATGRPTPVNDHFKRKIREFESDNVEIRDTSEGPQ
jgi:acyl-CoA thioester hydrolase